MYVEVRCESVAAGAGWWANGHIRDITQLDPNLLERPIQQLGATRKAQFPCKRQRASCQEAACVQSSTHSERFLPNAPVEA